MPLHAHDNCHTGVDADLLCLAHQTRHTQDRLMLPAFGHPARNPVSLWQMLGALADTEAYPAPLQYHS
jgi:hypothetical protein